MKLLTAIADAFAALSAEITIYFEIRRNRAINRMRKIVFSNKA